MREKVNAVKPRLPADADDPVFQQFDINDSPVLQLALRGDGSISPLQLRKLVDDTFVPEIQRISGVGSVDVSGGQQRQINVLLDLGRLEAHSLLPSQVSSTISKANSNRGLGNLTSGSTSVNLRAPSLITQPSDIANLKIAGTSFYVHDVATVPGRCGGADQLRPARWPGCGHDRGPQTVRVKYGGGGYWRPQGA